MRDFPVKAPGDTFSSDEFNESIGGELENYIVNTGLTLTALTTNQMAQAGGLYAGAATFSADSGSTNAYVTTVLAPFEAPPILPDGYVVRFFPGNTNTGASTLNHASTGAKALVKDAGLVALVGGEIVLNEPLHAQYDIVSDQWQIIQSGFQVGAGGAGAVASVFGRTGAVVAVSGDYDCADITNSSGVPGADVCDALDTLNANKGIVGIQTFTSGGTYTPTAGTSNIKVICTGAGAGVTGAGGTSSFGAFCSATGGQPFGGTRDGGNGTGGDINIGGGHGDNDGGASFWGGGKEITPGTGVIYGAGFNGGGAGGTAIKVITSGFSGTTVTIGSGGTTNGADGVVVIEEYS